MTSLTVLNHEIHLMDNLYSLNDLHKASGGQDKHRPAFFVRNQEVKELASEIMQCANLHSEQVLRKVNGGENRGTYGCKEIVYRYAMWISPKFALAVIRVFDAFVTGKLKPVSKTTVSDRVPLKDAVNVFVAKSSLNYSDAYKMVHQFMGVDSIDKIPLEDLPKAVAYVHSLTLVANNQQPTEAEHLSPHTTNEFKLLWKCIGLHQYHEVNKTLRDLEKTLYQAENQLRQINKNRSLIYDALAEPSHPVGGKEKVQEINAKAMAFIERQNALKFG